MKTVRRFTLPTFLSLLIVALFFTACQPKATTPTAPSSFPTAAATAHPTAAAIPTLIPLPTATPFPLTLVTATPANHGLLTLRPTLTFKFNRPLQAASLRKAFAFTSAQAPNQPLPGELTLADERTVRFTPQQPLQPNSTYTAAFSTALTTADGQALPAAVTLTYTTEDALSVSRTYPTGDDVAPDADITIVFNKPAAPLTTREDPAAAVPLQISPAVKGTARWVSTSILLFHPEEPLASNTTYTVTLPQNFTTPQGESLRQPLQWRFHVRAPAVDAIKVDNFNALDSTPKYVRLDAAIEIRFAQPMEQTSTLQALGISSNAPYRAAIPAFTSRWNADATKLTLIPQSLYALDTTYTITLSTQARAQDGGTLAQPVVAQFHTVGLPRLINDAHLYQQFFTPWAGLDFNTYLDPDSLQGHIVISPEVPNLTWQAFDRYLNIGVLEAGTTYTITLLPGIRDIYGHETTQPLSVQITTAHLEPSGGVYLPTSRPAQIRIHGPQQITVHTANLTQATLTLYALDTKAFLGVIRHPYDVECGTGKPVGVVNLPVADDPRDKEVRRTIALREFNHGHDLPPGAYCLRFSQQPTPEYGKGYDDNLLYLVTDNITLETDAAHSVAWVTDWDTGAPVANLPVHFLTVDYREKQITTATQGNTDAQGLASVPQGANYAVVSTGEHFAVTSLRWGLDDNPFSPGYYNQTLTSPPAYTLVIYTDRTLYRPGQTVFFKGILRQKEDGHYAIPAGQIALTLQAEGGKAIFQQTLSLSPLGTFAGKVDLPAEAEVGTYFWNAQLITPAKKEDILPQGAVRVAMYHKPVFEVRLTPDKPHLLTGEEATVRLEATYYAGDAVANAQVRATIEEQPSTFTPPDALSDYTFTDTRGEQGYWWFGSANETPTWENEPQAIEGTTDAQGRFLIPLKTQADKNQGDRAYTVWATVTDAGGNSADGHTTIIARQSEVYVGLRTPTWLGIAGEATTVQVVVVDPQGNPLPDHPVQVKVEEVRWHSAEVRGADGVLRWETQEETIPITAFEHVQTDAQGKAAVPFTPDHAGTYRFVAQADDAQGHTRRASLTWWVSGPEALLWAQNDAHALPLIPDHRNYRPNDVAHVLVPNPYAAPAYALVTLANERIYETHVVRLEQPNNLVPITLNKDMAPRVFVSVLVLRGAANRPPADFRFGIAPLDVALDEQQVEVRIQADKARYAPGETAHFTIETRTKDGAAIPAEVSLALVDKAIFALAPDTLNLMDAFYSPLDLKVYTALGLLGDLETYNARLKRALPEGPGMGSGGGGKGADTWGVITQRENLRDTAFWQAAVQTDAQGRAQVDVTLPDNLTTWVMTARAVTTDTRVGQSTAEITVSQPFFVQLHTPAFFIGGDTAFIQAVLHNTTDQPIQAQARLSKTEGLTLHDPVEQQTTVPAKGQAVVTWRASASLQAQRVILRVEARGGAYSDATRPVLAQGPEGSLPVYQNRITEVVGTSGVLPQPAEVDETLRLPGETANTALTLDLAPSLLGQIGQTAIPAALGQQTPSSPARCPIAQADRLLAYAALAHALRTVGVQPQWQGQLDQAIETLIRALISEQGYDGGWAWCNTERLNSQPTPTAQTLLALTEAQAAGYAVDADVPRAGYRALGEMLARDGKNSRYSADERAFFAYVAARKAPARASGVVFDLLSNHTKDLSTEGWGWLGQTAALLHLDDQSRQRILQQLENRVALSATGAHWDGRGWSPPRVTTAVVLDALLALQPDAAVLPQAARWLADAQKAHADTASWQDGLVYRALAHWAQAHEAQPPDFDYEVLFADTAQRGHMDKAHMAETVTLHWSGEQLPAGQQKTLRIRHLPGPGTLYYTAYLETTVPAGQLPARDDGIAVQRAYYAIEDLHNPAQTFHVGGLVQVRLTVTLHHHMGHVVVTDYLPAGFEVVNANVAWQPRADEGYRFGDFYRYGWGSWLFDHRENYDERVVFVGHDLPAGVYTLTYYVRAAVRGDYQARPAEAYAARYPDLRGRSAGAEVKIR